MWCLIKFEGAFHRDDLDKYRWSEITWILAHQRNWWIHPGKGLTTSSDVRWSDWSQILILIWIIPKERTLSFHVLDADVWTWTLCNNCVMCLDRRQLNCCYVRNILHNKVTPCMIITMKVKFISTGRWCKLCYFYSIIQSLTYCFVRFQDQFDGHQRKGRFLGRTSEQRAKNSMKLKRM